jgi:hypothetical protein
MITGVPRERWLVLEIEFGTVCGRTTVKWSGCHFLNSEKSDRRGEKWIFAAWIMGFDGKFTMLLLLSRLLGLRGRLFEVWM